MRYLWEVVSVGILTLDRGILKAIFLVYPGYTQIVDTIKYRTIWQTIDNNNKRSWITHFELTAWEFLCTVMDKVYVFVCILAYNLIPTVFTKSSSLSHVSENAIMSKKSLRKTFRNTFCYLNLLMWLSPSINTV